MCPGWFFHSIGSFWGGLCDATTEASQPCVGGRRRRHGAVGHRRNFRSGRSARKSRTARAGHSADAAGKAGRSPSGSRTCSTSATTSRTGRPRASRCRAASRCRTGVRVKLAAGHDLGQARRDDAGGDQERRMLWPAGFLPLPHPHHEEAAWCSRSRTSTRSRSRTERDLTRFDLDFDLPDHFLPEFPPPIYLTTRPDLGDVSQGQAGHDRQLLRAVQRTSSIPKQLEGLRLLVTPFPQQQFNATEDRRSVQAQPRRRLLRLPRQRPHQRRHAPGRRHPAAGVPPPHRHAVAARREHPAAVRLAARAEDASRTSPSSSSAPPTSTAIPVIAHARRASTSSSAAARCTSWPSSRSCSTSRRRRSSNVFGKLDPTKAQRGGAARPGAVLRQGAVRRLPPGAVLHRQPDAQPAGRALLQAEA